MLRENSKLNTIELPINRDFLDEKRRTLKEKTLPSLCQNRESSLKFTRIPLFVKAYSYFFKSKWWFSLNLVRDQANNPHIKSSTFNLETSNHDSRSSFIAPSDHNVSWRSNQRNLLYSFIVKIHTENCTHTHIYKSNTNWLFVTLFHDHVIYLLRKLCVQILDTFRQYKAWIYKYNLISNLKKVSKVTQLAVSEIKTSKNPRWTRMEKLITKLTRMSKERWHARKILLKQEDFLSQNDDNYSFPQSSKHTNQLR